MMTNNEKVDTSENISKHEDSVIDITTANEITANETTANEIIADETTANVSSVNDKTVESVDIDQMRFVNWILIGAGLVTLVIGFILLSLNFITLSPIFILSSYFIIGLGLLV